MRASTSNLQMTDSVWREQTVMSVDGELSHQEGLYLLFSNQLKLTFFRMNIVCLNQATEIWLTKTQNSVLEIWQVNEFKILFIESISRTWLPIFRSRIEKSKWLESPSVCYIDLFFVPINTIWNYFKKYFKVVLTLAKAILVVP